MKDKVYEDLIAEAKKYVSTRYELLQLEVLEKSSLVLALFFTTIICSFLAFIALAYFSFALILASESWFGGSIIPGLCISGAFFIITIRIVLYFKKALIINPTIKVLSTILYKKREKSSETNTDNDVENTIKTEVS